MIVDPDWLLDPALFSDDQCDRLIAAAMAMPMMAGDMTWKSEMPAEPEVRSSTLRWLYRIDRRFDWAFAAADAMLDRAQLHFEMASAPFEAFQFTEYHARRRGHYDWHRDDFGHEHDRVLSLCIQLAPPADYFGGELELRVGNPPPKSLLRRRGAAIAFRSQTWHRVAPTVSGVRYSAVGWRLAMRSCGAGA